MQSLWRGGIGSTQRSGLFRPEAVRQNWSQTAADRLKTFASPTLYDGSRRSAALYDLMDQSTLTLSAAIRESDGVVNRYARKQLC